MWLLHFLPDSLLHFIVNAVLIAGAVGSFLFFVVINRFLRFIPALAPYYTLGQIASAVLLVAGVYFKGGMSAEDAWRERVREMEAKVAAAEQRAQELNEELDKKAKEKTQYIRGRTEYITRYIENNVGKYDDKFNKDGQCAIPQEFVKAHNDGARKPEAKK